MQSTVQLLRARRPCALMLATACQVFETVFLLYFFLLGYAVNPARNSPCHRQHPSLSLAEHPSSCCSLVRRRPNALQPCVHTYEHMQSAMCVQFTQGAATLACVITVVWERNRMAKVAGPTKFSRPPWNCSTGYRPAGPLVNVFAQCSRKLGADHAAVQKKYVPHAPASTDHARSTLGPPSTETDALVVNVVDVVDVLGGKVAQAVHNFDIDAADGDEPNNVVEHLDIYEYLRQCEVKYQPSADYMASQTDITVCMRAILVNWLIDVHHMFRLRRETV